MRLIGASNFSEGLSEAAADQGALKRNKVRRFSLIKKYLSRISKNPDFYMKILRNVKCYSFQRIICLAMQKKSGKIDLLKK